MTMTSQQAMDIAQEAHNGQIDKNGEPYFAHVARVATGVGAYAQRVGMTPDELTAITVVAWLHDVLEDTHVQAINLRIAGLGLSQEIALRALTRYGDETYDAYIGRVILCPMARRVKLVDLYDNLRPDRVAAAGTYGLVRRYTAAYKRLMAAELELG